MEIGKKVSWNISFINEYTHRNTPNQTRKKPSKIEPNQTKTNLTKPKTIQFSWEELQLVKENLMETKVDPPCKK